MEDSNTNLIEIGVGLIFAVATLAIIMLAYNYGRDSAIAVQKREALIKQTQVKAEFGSLNGEVVQYARLVELITNYAGELDIYIDKTDANYSIITSYELITGKKAITDCVNRQSTVLQPTKTNDVKNSYYAWQNKCIDLILNLPMTTHFGTGSWKVYVITNNSFVGSASGSIPDSNDTVTGLRFVRQ